MTLHLKTRINKTIEETFSKVATRLMMQLESMNGSPGQTRVVYITSAREREGKTYVSTLIGHYCAKISDKKVLLLDANFDHPELGWFFGIKPGPGVSEYMTAEEDKPVSLTTHPTSLPNLWVLPAGQKAHPTQLHMLHKVKNLFGRILGRFDVIIVDGSSIERGAANALPQFADGVILVVDGVKTKIEDVSGIPQKLNIEPQLMLGAILNRESDPLPRFISG